MDTRCRSSCSVAAALEILNRLSFSDDTLWEEDEWSAKGHIDPFLPYALEEDDADACDPCLYDPALFSPAPSIPASPLQSTFSHCSLSDRDKPLPPPPDYISTPRLSHSPVSTPPSSPRVSIAPHMLPLPRSRPPSTSMGSSRVVNTHATFPSISSTLSLLEERETEVAKRSGVIVTELQDLEAAAHRISSESVVLAHPPVRKSSIDAFHVFPTSDGSPKRKSRPTLNLATSPSSSPHLCTLADLATIPASPISYTSVSRSVSHQPSMASLATSQSSLLEPAEIFSEPDTIPDTAPCSRWSVDSTDAMYDIPRASTTSPGSESPQSAPKARKRDRLRSFISRARAGSLGKHSPTYEPESGSTSPRDSILTTLPSQSVVSLGLSSRRTSHAVYEPQPISASTSTSTTTSTSSVSTASLVTPADSQQDVSVADPFCPASPTFTPVSYLPSVPDVSDSSFSDEADAVALEPTLPPPSPDTPSPSFFLPAKQETNPLLKLARRTMRRRKKKLVIACIPAHAVEDPEDEGQARIAAQRRQREEKRRYECIVKWCESFGVVRRFERNSDGSIHVYWRDWEVADMVCRVSAQVLIKGVGRVSLAWRYVN